MKIKTKQVVTENGDEYFVYISDNDNGKVIIDIEGITFDAEKIKRIIDKALFRDAVIRCALGKKEECPLGDEFWNLINRE